MMPLPFSSRHKVPEMSQGRGECICLPAHPAALGTSRVNTRTAVCDHNSKCPTVRGNGIAACISADHKSKKDIVAQRIN